MKRLFVLAALHAVMACHAAESDAAAAAPVGNAPKDRCPPPRLDKLVKVPEGEFKFVVRYLVKADGSVENVRVDGGKASREARVAARNAFDRLRCQPAETDEEYVSELRVGSRRVD